MIIYEINLVVEQDIFSEYMLWLAEHIQKILKFPGFSRALTLQEKNSEQEHQHIRVQYSVETQDFLNDYLTNHANRLRQEGLEKFANKFTISRKIFQTLGEAHAL